jgi:hypothetical protein
MGRSPARVSVAAALAIAGAGAAALAVLPADDPDQATSPTSLDGTVASSEVGPTTSGVPAFSDGEDARAAAEDLIATYIATEYGEAVTDAACSVPETGSVGEQFACYALKPGDLVIALRATVAEERLIELTLILDQTATTTTAATETTTA